MSEFVFLFRSTEAEQREAMGTPERAQREHAALAGLDTRAGSEGAPEEPGTAARARRGRSSAASKRVITDGPYVEAKDLVLGFIVVEARDLARGGGALDRLPDPRGRRIGGGAPGRELACQARSLELRRASLPARVGAHGRRAHANLRRAQPGAGRRRRAGRLLPGAGGVEGARRSGEPGRVADDDGEEPRARRHPARADGAHVRAGARPAAREPSGRSRRSSTRRSPRQRSATSSCG